MMHTAISRIAGRLIMVTVITVIRVMMIGVLRRMMMSHILAKNLMPIPGCEQQRHDEQQQWIGKESAHQIRLGRVVTVISGVKRLSVAAFPAATSVRLPAPSEVPGRCGI